jgi:hypothetical protein
VARDHLATEAQLREVSGDRAARMIAGEKDGRRATLMTKFDRWRIGLGQ